MIQITCLVITCHLFTLMRWILLGPNQNFTSESPDNSFENCVSLRTQFMTQSFKTKLQMRYSPVRGIQRQVSNYVETPVSVSLGIMLYQRREVKF